MKRKHGSLAASLLAVALVSCQAQESGQDSGGPAAQGRELPVSINAAMVGLIDQSADFIWAVGNGDLPRDNHDWDQVRGAVYDMILGGTIIQMPGTGPFDEQWVAEENWQHYASQLTEIGQDALPLAETKSADVEAWRTIGDRLVENCLGCHEAFKPEIPSQGILHESTERESRGMSIFD